MRRVYGLLLALLLPAALQAQNILMPAGGTATHIGCSGTVYDPGGPNAVYANSQNVTLTLRPTANAWTAQRAQIAFTLVSLESNFDFLEIYDGPDTSAPRLARLTGSQGQGQTYTATNERGALTLRLITDDLVVQPGFAATLSCVLNPAAAVGNVGIGTTQPEEKLHVAGTIYSSTGGVRFPDGTLQTSAAVTTAPDNLGNHTATQNLGLSGFWLSNATGSANGLRIDDNGNVGVGTAAPTQRLDVAGDINSSGVLRQGGRPSLYWRGNNTYLGTDNFAGTAPTGTDNLFVGTAGGQALTTGTRNTTLGHQAGNALTAGINNVLLGHQAGSRLTSGNSNIMVGSSAGALNSAGGNNIGIGNAALANIEGSNNIAIGSLAGIAALSGTGNLLLGTRADVGGGNDRNRATAIGFNAVVGQDDAVVLGDPSNADVRVGIGTSTPAQKLDVNGQVYSRSGGFRFPDNTVQTTAANPDNLGNHTATEPLKYSTNDADKILFLNATGANGPKLSHGSGWTLDYYAGPNSGNNGVHRFLTGTASGWQERVRIANNGRLGIGTTNPQAQLDVNGYLRVSGASATPSAGTVPNVAFLELNATMPSTAGTQVTIDHGLNAAKILGLQVLVDCGSNGVSNGNLTPPVMPDNGNELYYAYLNGNRVVLRTGVLGTSGQVLGRPARILITYKE